MDSIDIDSDNDQDEEVPIFTAELAKMKAEAMGQTYNMSDEEMAD